MMQAAEKNEVIQQLQREIRSLEGLRKASGGQRPDTGLGPVEWAFPDRTFPLGAVHEFISHAAEDAAATHGFISGLMGKLMQGGACLWVSCRRTIYPPALKLFGVDPDQIIFIDLARPKDVLWVVEEALKCGALAAVVGELKELSFTESRRLQLAVEQSHVTGFIHRVYPRSENTVACTTRWKISPVPGAIEEGMPGVGFPRWDVQLLKVRNGKPGKWQLEWSGGGFRYIPRPVFALPELQTRKTG